MSQFPTSDKPLPIVPQPPMSALSLSPYDDNEDTNEVTPLPSAKSSDQEYTTDITKRDYALLELLDSERTYASDLILIRDYQIPLASGRLSSISNVWPVSNLESTIRRYPGLELPTSYTHTISPASAPRPLTSASEASAMSLDSIFTLRPMKTKDINIVFGNIEELAAFSEEFLDSLESALGELIEGNEGEDYVGRFFLEYIPKMELLYTTYVMNQPRALEHYHHLSKTFQFDIYFPRSQILAHKSSNAWDLPSLLIKPVQRLLHYPQLLAAILAETPDSHGDKANLVEAHTRIQSLARDLNAQWSQQNVVREGLAGAGPVGDGDGARAKKKGGLAASLNLGRIMGVLKDVLKAKEGSEVVRELKAIMGMWKRLMGYESFMAQFAGEAVNWVDAMRTAVGALDGWAQSLSKVVRTDSNALEAFFTLVRNQLLTACDTVETEIKDDILQVTKSLKATMVGPMSLLQEVAVMELLHDDLILEAHLRAHLRAQLSAELPKYLIFLDRGMAVCILKLAHVQQRFYGNVRDKWAELRDHIGVEDDINEGTGAVETFLKWRKRFNDVDERLMRLNIVRHPGENPPLVKQRAESDDQYIASNESGGEAISSAALASGRPRTYPNSDEDEWITPSDNNQGWQSAHNTSDIIQQDDHRQRSRTPSLLRQLDRMTPSRNILGDVRPQQQGTVIAKEAQASKSSPQVARLRDPSRTVAVYEAAEDSDDSDSSDGAAAGLSYWDADKLTLQKPIVKRTRTPNQLPFGSPRPPPHLPRSPPHEGSPSAGWPATHADDSEPSANANSGTRLVSSHLSYQAPHPVTRRT